MKQEHTNKLHKMHSTLCDIQMELQGYATLFSSIYNNDSIEGSHLLGPGHRLNVNAQKILKICRNLDDLLVQVRLEKNK